MPRALRGQVGQRGCASTSPRAAVTLAAARRPDAVRASATDRPSRPGRRLTWPACSRRSTSLTVPDAVSPSTRRSRSIGGSSRKWYSADKAIAALSDWPAAPPTASAVRSAIDSDSAPRRLPARSSSGPPEGAAGRPDPARWAHGPRQARGVVARSLEVVLERDLGLEARRRAERPLDHAAPRAHRCPSLRSPTSLLWPHHRRTRRPCEARRSPRRLPI